MSDQRFLREHHIRRRADFRRAYGRRCTVSDDLLVVFAAPNDLPYARLGLTVSRKVGKAVIRNRWKRLIREAFRLSRQRLPAGIDLVVVPRPTAEAKLRSLLQSLPRLAHRAARRLTASGGSLPCSTCPERPR